MKTENKEYDKKIGQVSVLLFSSKSRSEYAPIYRHSPSPVVEIWCPKKLIPSWYLSQVVK